MLSWILPKNQRLGNFMYLLKIAPAFVFWKNPGQHIFFQDFLTIRRSFSEKGFTSIANKKFGMPIRAIRPWHHQFRQRLKFMRLVYEKG